MWSFIIIIMLTKGMMWSSLEIWKVISVDICSRIVVCHKVWLEILIKGNIWDKLVEEINLLLILIYNQIGVFIYILHETFHGPSIIRMHTIIPLTITIQLD